MLKTYPPWSSWVLSYILCTYTHMYIIIYIYIHIYTHIYTYTHTHTHLFLFFPFSLLLSLDFRVFLFLDQCCLRWALAPAPQGAWREPPSWATARCGRWSIRLATAMRDVGSRLGAKKNGEVMKNGESFFLMPSGIGSSWCFFDLRYEWNIENVTNAYTCRELNIYIYTLCFLDHMV